MAIVDSAFGLISYPLIEHRNLELTNHICKLTICPADRNKAMMFYAPKLEQGVASIDKPAEDTGTTKAPLIPVHRCQWAGH